MEILSSKSQFQSGGKLPTQLSSQSNAKSNIRLKLRTLAVIALILALSLAGMGCSSQWISVALADLPVLAQMALNIGTIVNTMQSGKQLSPEEISAVQNISAETGRDLNLLQSLYNDYKSSLSADTIQKIDAEIAHISQPSRIVAGCAYQRSHARVESGCGSELDCGYGNQLRGSGSPWRHGISFLFANGRISPNCNPSQS